MRDCLSTRFPEIELQYRGREENACGATATLTQFKAEQKQLIEGAFARTSVPDTTADRETAVANARREVSA
jgi:hypothetical protein